MYRMRLVLVIGTVLGSSSLLAQDLNPGGATTVPAMSTERAYSQPAANLNLTERNWFSRGDHLFRGAGPGLGPLYNATSCQGCHVRDGRGNFPSDSQQPMVSSFLRLSIPGQDEHGGVVPEPVYGDQLQTFAVAGVPVEGFSYVEYQEQPGQFADGTAYSLRQPIYKVRDLGYGAFAAGVMFSPRTAPPVYGLGLIEAIAEADILALADAQDRNGDGISGKANRSWSVLTQRYELGRFGLKAGNPSILQQLSGAYRGDMGVTNPVFHGEVCTPAQTACLDTAQQERGIAPNVDELNLALVEFYNRTLGVPQTRPTAEFAAGQALFSQLGCASCHTPSFTTGELSGSQLGAIDGLGLKPNAPVVNAVSKQRIAPYSDFLLHDMGGECQPVKQEQGVWVQHCQGLADGRPEGLADGREWRTAPLWGIGLTQQVNERAGFLHDGRARDVSEAILWHGGEAQSAREAFRQLPKTQREQLLQFVQAL